MEIQERIHQTGIFTTSPCCWLTFLGYPGSRHRHLKNPLHSPSGLYANTCHNTFGDCKIHDIQIVLPENRTAKGPLNKSLNCIFPAKNGIRKSLKAGHWLSQMGSETPNTKRPQQTHSSSRVDQISQRNPHHHGQDHMTCDWSLNASHHLV